MNCLAMNSHGILGLPRVHCTGLSISLSRLRLTSRLRNRPQVFLDRIPGWLSPNFPFSFPRTFMRTEKRRRKGKKGSESGFVFSIYFPFPRLHYEIRSFQVSRLQTGRGLTVTNLFFNKSISKMTLSLKLNGMEHQREKLVAGWN